MSKKLTENDFAEAAQFLNCSVAAVKAVALVESGGRGGFDDKNRVLIRYEGHKFRSFTKGKFDLSHPQVSYGYHRTHRTCGNIHGYTAFNSAFELDSLAAMKSCSIGMFQPMVFNYHEMGYATPAEMWDDFRTGERAQLLAFCRLIKEWKLDDELRRATLSDFTTFARIYNGEDFRANDYHNKMFRNFSRFKKQPVFGDLQDDEIELEIPQTASAPGADPVTPPQNISPPSDRDQDAGINSVVQPSVNPAPISAPGEPKVLPPPTGDNPQPSLSVEDLKPFVKRWLTRVWTFFTGFNATQVTAFTGMAVNDSENWYWWLAAAAVVFLILLFFALLVSTVLGIILWRNRDELKHYFTLRAQSLIDPDQYNLGLQIEKK